MGIMSWDLDGAFGIPLPNQALRSSAGCFLWNLNVFKENSMTENQGQVLGVISFRQGILGPKFKIATGWHSHVIIASLSRIKPVVGCLVE